MSAKAGGVEKNCEAIGHSRDRWGGGRRMGNLKGGVCEKKLWTENQEKNEARKSFERGSLKASLTSNCGIPMGEVG